MRRLFHVLAAGVLLLVLGELALWVAGQAVGWGYRRSHRAVPVAESSAGPFRILCVGDSFTFGVGAPPGGSYPAQLESVLPGAQVINAGLPGTSSPALRKRLPSLMEKYQPQGQQRPAATPQPPAFTETTGRYRQTPSQPTRVVLTRAEEQKRINMGLTKEDAARIKSKRGNL